jgi:hypothetical protein
MMHYLNSPVIFLPFWTGNFLIVVKEEGPKFPGPSFSRSHLDIFLWKFVEDIVDQEKT